MRFISLTENTAEKSELETDYKASHKIGIAGVGEKFFFIKKPFKSYYIDYSSITRAYRRVYLVPAKMCCASGELEVEYLVVCSEKGEIAQFSLPGKRAAELLIEEIKQTAPFIDCTCPKKDPDEPTVSVSMADSVGKKRK